MVTIVLFLLVFMSGWRTGLAAWHQLDDHVSSMCDITIPFISPYVSASLERNVNISGCVSNSTVSSTGAEVHAINYNYKSGRRAERNSIDLFIKARSKGVKNPLIIVLTSPVRVRWHVKVDSKDPDQQQHLFMVSKGSGIRFANKHVQTHPRVEKHGSIPNEASELLLWLQNKFSAVTSLSDLSEGSTITLTVGGGSPLPPTCNLRKNSSPLPTVATVKHGRQLEGCLANRTNRKDTDIKLAYILELKNMAENQTFNVDLEITRPSWQAVDRKFSLVLKAPDNVRWIVQTRKLQGSVNIVANSYVDMSGIPKDMNVQVRSEELPYSGRDLLNWVEYYIGPVAMYTTINNTNQIKIVLPAASAVFTEPVAPSVGPDSLADDVRFTLKQAMRKECSQESVVVTIDRLTVQKLGLKQGQITLADRACIAHEDSGNLVLVTSPYSCGTQLIRSNKDLAVYGNTLVVHSNHPLDSDLLEETGSGEGDIFSGSGSSDLPDVYLDDEDIGQGKMKIDFTCIISKVVSGKLELFESILFQNPVTHFPYDTKFFKRRLYVQAAVLSNQNLQAQVHNCWLSPHLTEQPGDGKNHYTLIENKCPVDRTVSWLKTKNKITGSVSNIQRLTFSMENYVQQASNPQAYLMCQLTYCCHDDACNLSLYPKCVDLPDGCERHRHGGHSSREVTKHLVVVGPLNLPLKIGPNDAVNPINGGPKTKVIPSTTLPEVADIDKEKRGDNSKSRYVIDGLDSGTVVGIAFAAFVIGVLMMGALWFIHTHSGSFFVSGPFKRGFGNNGSTENENDFGETTPGSSVPIST